MLFFSFLSDEKKILTDISRHALVDRPAPMNNEILFFFVSLFFLNYLRFVSMHNLVCHFYIEKKTTDQKKENMIEKYHIN
jgi:hypothetical protein